MVSSNFPNRPFRLEATAWLISQNVSANTSRIGGDVWIRKNSYSPSFSLGNNSSFTFRLNGSQVAGWSFGYDFRNSDALHLARVEATVGHNTDGSKTAAIDAYANVDILGYTETHGSITLPKIPRASVATWAVAGNAVAGVARVLNTNRASSSFTHNIDYYVGKATGRALTGIGASGTWTPPLTLLNEMPNAASTGGRLRTYTYNGSSLIGWTESTFTLAAGPEIVPTWTSATVGPRTDAADQAIANIIGAGKYVQTLSRIKGTITGAAGVYGSTIATVAQTVGGQTINSVDAPFDAPLSVSGSQVPVVQTITDSRGRTKTQTTNIEVLPYSKPVITGVRFVRANATGPGTYVFSPSGTSMVAVLIGSVQSIVNTTERNRLSATVRWKPNGAASWVGSQNIVVDSTTLSFEGAVLINGPFDVATSYVVSLELSDKFTTTTSTKNLGTGEIFQHWAAGLGVGKYWERGMLDIKGDGYASGGLLSLGRRVTDANQAIYEGRYHMNGGSNLPPAGPNGNANGQCVLDVDTWYEVQESLTFHYVRQKARWIQSRPNSDSRRNINASLMRGYGMVRYSANGGSTWTAWASEDPAVGIATSTGGVAAQDPITGRYDFQTTARSVVFDGVFMSDVQAYRVDYYYRTGDANGSYWRLRSGGTYPSGVGYSGQNMRIAGTGTPAGTVTASNANGPLASHTADVHSGHLVIYNPMTAGLVKTWTAQEETAAPTGTTVHSGNVTGGDSLQFDGFLLSTSATMNTFTHGWIRFTALF